jgi:hypothetical protein
MALVKDAHSSTGAHVKTPTAAVNSNTGKQTNGSKSGALSIKRAEHRNESVNLEPLRRTSTQNLLWRLKDRWNL